MDDILYLTLFFFLTNKQLRIECRLPAGWQFDDVFSIASGNPTWQIPELEAFLVGKIVANYPWNDFPAMFDDYRMIFSKGFSRFFIHRKTAPW
jgi:hypothetical protein